MGARGRVIAYELVATRTKDGWHMKESSLRGSTFATNVDLGWFEYKGRAGPAPYRGFIASLRGLPYYGPAERGRACDLSSSAPAEAAA
uniref:Uncharacterized protein n=1 Tax=uncultured nuHF2 cluster bacterium HF0500_31B05 TaxID=723589 RepID=E7C5X7_9BACT|nr:hypothetical protein [uncultured nuHF2 cluster bacterium HF0500_31B05]